MNLPMRRQISSEPTSTEKVFWAEKFEYTTAIGLLTSLFSFILLITANFLSKKISDNSLW